VQFGRWKRADGAEQNTEIVGFNPDSDLGGPWNLVEGRIEDLKLADTVIVDRLYMQKLGVTRLGETSSAFLSKTFPRRGSMAC
jgi:putative ABC transport system permease protein